MLTGPITMFLATTQRKNKKKAVAKITRLFLNIFFLYLLQQQNKYFN